MSKKIGFSFECDQDHTKMERGPENTRHCTQCSRNIVDFTKMSPHEIAEHIKNANKPCGFMMPWQLDQVNEHLENSTRKINPLAKLAKVAAVVSAPLLTSPLMAQKPETVQTVNTTSRVSKPVSEILVKNKSGMPLDSLQLEVYKGETLIKTFTTDASGKIYLDHFFFNKTIILKNKNLGIESTFHLKDQPSCIVWKTELEEVKEFIPVKYDLQFKMYNKGKAHNILFSKVEIELYDSSNNLIETIEERTNVGGYSLMKTAQLENTEHILFIVHTRKGRRTASRRVNAINKEEVNIITVNKFRPRRMGVTYSRF